MRAIIPNPDDGIGVGTIFNVLPPVVTVDDVSVEEGEDLEFTVYLSDPRTGDPVIPRVGEKVIVDYEVRAQSAMAGDDFVDPPDGTIELDSGNPTGKVTVETLFDRFAENPETLLLHLTLCDSDADPADSCVHTVARGDSSAVGTILDVLPPEVTVDDPRVEEGEDLEFTVYLSDPRTGDPVIPRAGEKVIVDYEVLARSAKAGNDFIDPPDGTIELDSDNPTGKVTVVTVLDRIAENPETLLLSLTLCDSDASDTDDCHHTVALGDSAGVGTILNVNLPVIRALDASADEGEELEFGIAVVDDGGAPAAAREDIAVSLVVSDGTATGGTDCSSADFIRRFGNHSFSKDIVVTVPHPVSVTTCEDVEVERTETVRMTLTLDDPDALGAVLGDRIGIGEILDSPPPGLTVANATAEEGEDLEFKVTLSRATSEAVTVTATTEDATAIAPGDYTAKSQTLTFAPNTTEAAFLVTTNSDDEREDPDETLRVVLSNPSGALIDRAIAVGTIKPKCVDKDDPLESPPTLSVPDVAVQEGSSASLGAYLSQPMCQPFQLKLSWAESPEANTAECGVDMLCTDRPKADYQAPDSVGAGTFTRRSGPIADGIDEDDEILLRRANWGPDMPAHYQGLEWAEGIFTIVDVDPPPTLTVSDGDAEAGQPVIFEVRLTPASAKTVTVEYRTADMTATDTDDYDAESGALTFLPGETSKQVQVQTQLNSVDETDEVFRLELSMPDNATVGDGIGIGTIRVGELPVLRIADARAAEGDDDMVFTVSLSEAHAQDVSVEYKTVPRPAGVGAATEGDDYTAVSGTLTIAAGDQSGDISVPIEDDGISEFDETFLVELTNPMNASLGDPSAVGTITGDRTCIDRTDASADPPTVTFTYAGSSTIEAAEDAGTVAIDFVLSEPFCQETLLRFEAGSGGTAVLNEDFTIRSVARLALDAHQMDSRIELSVIDDLLIEPDETAVLSLSSAGQVKIDSRFTVSIIDNDRDSAQVSVQDASAAEGGTVGFTVRLDRGASEPVTVDYVTVVGSATEGDDYTAVSGTLTIAAGDLSALVRVRTRDDDLDEDDETFELELTNARFARAYDLQFAPGGDKARGTIIDNDPLPSVRVTDTGAPEGEPLIFTVSLDQPSGREVTVDYSTSDNTATAGSDYTAASAKMTFDPGETSKTVEVASLADDDLENAERFRLTLSAPVNASLADAVGIGTISDATERALRVSDAVATEGGVLRFEIDFDGAGETAAVEQVTVRYRTEAGTATAGDDYIAAAAGTATIAAGQSSTAVTVATVQDSLDEPNERFSLVISDPSGAVIAVARAVGVIVDDDPLPALEVDDPEATENGDGTPLTFTVSLSEASGRDVTVSYATADSTATAGADYTSTTGTLTIPAGDISGEVDVALIDDDTAESAETLQLRLSGPSNALLDDATGVGTIFDDAIPQITVDDAPGVLEADGASSSFAVRLSHDSATDVTVSYATADGTATAGADYTSTAGTLRIAAGARSATVNVPLIDDSLAESSETFMLVLSNPSSNAVLDPDPDKASAVIFDDESLPELSVLDAPDATEGGSARFELRLNRPSAQAITVQYRAVADLTAGTRAAAAGQDFQAVTGTATIAARSTTATVEVPLIDDLLDEFNETFWLRLADPVGAVLGDATAVGTIVDNDPLAQLSIADAVATEGDTLTFAVRLARASGLTVTVPWETAENSTANAAASGTDFRAASGTLTFAPGVIQRNVTVNSIQDETDEPDETLLVLLGEPVNAVVEDGVAVGAINDDDGLPRISISDARVIESESPLSFPVTLSRPSSQTVSVEYTFNDGTAVQPDDFDYLETSRTLVINAGSTEGELSVYIVDDGIDEGAETFSATLSNPQNAVIAEGRGTATGTIVDDESALISIADNSASESAGTIDFEVSLSAVRTEDTTVNYTTFDGTATQPDDYLAASGTLTIPAGEQTATLSVHLVNDSYRDASTPYPYWRLRPIPEDSAPETEAFLVRLSSPTGAALGDADAAGVIIDDDELPRLLLSSIAGVREDVGTVPVEVRLVPASNRVVTVDYLVEASGDDSCATVGGTSEGTLTFQPGDTAKNVIVTVVGKEDTQCSLLYGRVSFTVYLMRPVNARFESWGYHVPYGGRHIRNDFPVHDVDFDPPWEVIYVGEQGGTRRGAVSENAGEAVFRMILAYPLDDDKSAELGWYFGVSSATAGADYQWTPPTNLPSGTDGIVTIPAGGQEALLRLPIIDDNVAEDTEILRVCRFSYLINGSAPNWHEKITFQRGGRCGILEIHDDDTSVNVRVSDTAVSETAGKASVLVELDQVSGRDVAIDWATSDGTATEPGDYTSTRGRVEFAAGETERFVDVVIVDDDDEEGDETFNVVLSNPSSGAAIASDGSSATVTVRDDEAAGSLPVVTLYDADGLERGRGASIIVPGEIDKRLTEWASVGWTAVLAPWLGDEAADSSDLTQIRSSSMRFGPYPAGLSYPQEFGLIPFQQAVVNDNIPELDERFMVMLHDPDKIVLGNNFIWVTLIDDDLPEVTVADETVAEGGGQMEFTLRVHAPAVKTGTVDYEVLVLNSAGDEAAVPDQDYRPVSGTITFDPGDESKTVTVTVLDDADDELDKRFLLLLKNPKTLVLADASAVGIIEDDDDGWIINDDRELLEDSGPMVFTLTRDHTSEAPVTVNYTVTGASAVGGAACGTGVDYVTPSGQVTVQPADTQATISVVLCDDSDTESRETLLVELTGVPGRKLSATGTIIDND